MSFRNLKLGTKQLIGFAIVLVLMASTSIVALNTMRLLNKELEVVTNNWLQRVVAISDINIRASSLRLTQLQYALSDDPALRDSMIIYIDQINANQDLYEVLAQQTDSAGVTMDEAIYAGFDTSWEDYLDQTFTFLDLSDQGQTQEAVDLINGPISISYRAMQTRLDQLVTETRRGADDAAARAKATQSASRRAALLLLIAALVFSLAMVGIMMRYTAMPVSQLMRAARKVADGNLSVYLPVESEDEIGMLASSFNRMTSSLRDARQRSEEQSASIASQKAETDAKNHALESTLQQLKDTQEQLVVREKMASLGQLTAGIAHEIKNPLNFVNNFAVLSIDLADELDEILREQPNAAVQDVLGDVEEVLGDLKFNAGKINEHGRRADSIVRSMLLHSRGKSGEMQRTDLNRLVEDYGTLAYHGIRAAHPHAKLDIAYDLDAHLPEVDTIPQELGRVLINLMYNAFDAVDEHTDAAITLCTEAQGGNVRISVKDNGTGIPKEVRDRIFQPFFTTKAAGYGTGLGLSLSYDIVTQGHNGLLEVAESSAEGTTFRITLPVRHADAA
ncbi:MAG: ATP-binding protein [Bacteroidota bacterium]